MKRLAWLLLGALACCSHPPAAPPAAELPSPAVCRLGPDGGRPVADRGIGGTGAPVVQTADRGIGGTGIIGVVTGFASVCVAGEEVALPPGVSARMDDDPAQLDDLRAGQVVAIEASGQGSALAARRIMVRHAVIGPVEAAGPGTMTVAGQLVAVTGATGDAAEAKPGQWVAVSGLRAGNGMIVATRIDHANPGRVLVRGELARIYNTASIGSLPVQLPPDSNLPAAWPVTITGQFQGGVLVADSATLDVASQSPSAYFGPAVSNYIVESSVAVLAGGYLVARDFVSGSGFGESGTRDRAIARYSRSSGGLVATGLQTGGEAGGGHFTPAPTISGSSGLRGDGRGAPPFGGAGGALGSRGAAGGAGPVSQGGQGAQGGSFPSAGSPGRR